MNGRENKPVAGGAAPTKRAERLSGALRANLKRRKAQACARAHDTAAGPYGEHAIAHAGASTEPAAAAHDSAEFVAENTRGRAGRE